MENIRDKSIFEIISDRRFILLVGIIVRILITTNFTGWLHDDEVFQSMDIAYSIIYGKEIKYVLIPFEFRDQVRSYAWPFLLVISSNTNWTEWEPDLYDYQIHNFYNRIITHLII